MTAADSARDHGRVPQPRIIVTMNHRDRTTRHRHPHPHASPPCAPSEEFTRSAVLEYGALLLFPVLLADFVFWWWVDFRVYTRSLKEDACVEYVTFWCLLGTAALALLALRRAHGRQRWRSWFYLLCTLFCLVIAMEEISWGQRLMGVEPPAWFAHHSTQREINVHNVFQKWTGIKARHVVAAVMLLYGVLLPCLRRGHRLRASLDRRDIPIPPRFLVLGFLLASLAMIDLPTGREEEIGECFFSICLLLFMGHECLQLSAAARRPVVVLEDASASV
jgi:hypothetical protein